MKTLVLGAGFLGTEIVSCLLENKYQVVPARLSGKPIQINDQEVETVAIDVFDPQTFSKIPADTTHIIYLISARDGSEESYKKAYFEGVGNVITYLEANDLLAKTNFILISSTGVYAENNGGIVHEKSPVLEADKKYSQLLQGENLVLRKFQERGLVLRLSGIYGKGRRYFVKLAEVLSENLNKTKPEDLKINWSNRIHKFDAARACLHLIERGCSGTYVISDNMPSISIETIKFIQRKLNIKVLDLEIENRDQLPGKRCDNRKLLNEGFEFRYPSYEEGYWELIGL